MTEVVTVTAEAPPLQTDVAMRKTVEAKDLEQLSFSGRNPIGVAGAQGRRHRRQLQQPAASRAFSNGGFNINGSRSRREQHHGRRRHRHPHPVGRHHHRHPERRRDSGSAGPDRQLHARVRARERRPDPLRDQERQQPLHGQRLVLPCATSRCRPTPGRATAAPTRSRTAGPAPFDYKQYGYCLRRPDSRRARSRTSCSSSARRSG